MSGELAEGLESSSRLSASDEDAITEPSGSSPDLRPTPDLSGLRVSHFCWLLTDLALEPTQNSLSVPCNAVWVVQRQKPLRRQVHLIPSDTWFWGSFML